jgi:hypothetical protein
VSSGSWRESDLVSAGCCARRACLPRRASNIAHGRVRFTAADNLEFWRGRGHALRISATTQRGSDESVEIDKLPDSCPVCHHGIAPIPQKLCHFGSANGLRIELVFRCPLERCQSFFVARYFQYHQNFCLRECVPFTAVEADFSESIRSISADFCAIANEAVKAERQGWKLIAGPGYRKALEFLIKDYLCRLLPADAAKIREIQLGSCIANYVANEKVKAVAARAAWLGNDETHYTRKWNDRDLEDLKTLVQLTVHWIEMEEMTTSVVKGMPAKGNKRIKGPTLAAQGWAPRSASRADPSVIQGKPFVSSGQARMSAPPFQGRPPQDGSDSV